MFKISRTQEIKISRGDASGSFAINVNLGTSLKPMLHEFVSAFGVYQKPDYMEVFLNKKVFSKFAGKADDIYVFEYNYQYTSKGKRSGELGWYYEGEKINLEDCGITYLGKPEVRDRIAVSYYLNHISEIYFSVFDINDVAENYYFRKDFRNDGVVITSTNCGEGYSRKEEYNTVVDRNSMILCISAKDTEDMMPGEYRYQIKVKLYDEQNDEYIINTINYPTAFYVID